MRRLASTPLSVLDLAPIRQGGDVAETFANTVELARHVEALGFQRYCWPSITTSTASPTPLPQC